MRRILCILLIVSCRQRDVTLAADAVIREYAKPHAETQAAAQSVLEDLQLVGNPDVTVELTAIDANRTKVLAHRKPANYDWAYMFQEKLACELGLCFADAAYVEGRVGDGLEPCILAARRAFKVHDLLIVDEAVGPARARIDARRADSVPCRFLLTSIDADHTRVVILVGTERKDEYRTLARELRDEFNRGIPSGAGSPGR